MRRTCPCEHKLSTLRAAQQTGGPLPAARGPVKGREEAKRLSFSQGGRHPAALGVVQAQRGGKSVWRRGKKGTSAPLEG